MTEVTTGNINKKSSLKRTFSFVLTSDHYRYTKRDRPQVQVSQTEGSDAQHNTATARPPLAETFEAKTSNKTL